MEICLPALLPVTLSRKHTKTDQVLPPTDSCCPRWGGEKAWVLERRHLWECAACGRRASVTAGTVLHGTCTPPTLWFGGAYLVATHTPGISAVQLGRQLGLARHETAWLMPQKLRRAMVAPEREPLGREVERSTSSSSAASRRARTARASAARSRSAWGRSRRAGGARDGFGCGWSPTPLPARSAASSRRASSAGDRADRRLARLRRPGRTRLRPPPTQPARARCRGPRREPRAAAASRRLQPQELAARNPPRRLQRPPPGVPRRVRLPLQPPRQADGGLPDPARAGCLHSATTYEQITRRNQAAA